MFKGKIQTMFHVWKVSGEPYKVAYYMVGGQWRVPVHQIGKDGKPNGINSSAGFTSKEKAENFYKTGKHAHSIY